MAEPGAHRVPRPGDLAYGTGCAQQRAGGRINDYQTTIAAAVEEQTATTNEMARNVSEAAMGSSETAQNVVGFASAAEATTIGVAESQRAATDLARMSSELQALVGTFRY